MHSSPNNHQQRKAELWARDCREFCRKWRLPRHFWVLLHAVNLRHGADGFTSPPKDGVLRIFSPEKSDGFGRVWTRELGYQRPARLPLPRLPLRYIINFVDFQRIYDKFANVPELLHCTYTYIYWPVSPYPIHPIIPCYKESRSSNSNVQNMFTLLITKSYVSTSFIMR